MLKKLRLKNRLIRILNSHNRREHEIIKLNIHKNSVNGVLFIKKRKYFFKLLKKRTGHKEFAGYKDLIGKFPVPQLEKVFEDYDDLLLLYDYEESIKKDHGLLVDEINKRLHTSRKINLKEIFNIWKENFIHTAKWGIRPPSNMEFFKGRIKRGGRWDVWYKKAKVEINGEKILFKKLLKKQFIINKRLMKRSPYELYNIAKKNLTKRKRMIELVSQGDPIEMNIGMKPIFFDFDKAGLDDFLGENANFIYSVLIDGGYFSPKYHKDAFWLHPKSLKNIEEHKYKFLNYKIDRKRVFVNYELKIPKVRANILKQYFKEIIYPLIRVMGLSFERYDKVLSDYLFARFMLVHDVSKMETEDIFLTLAMISEIYDFGFRDYLKKLNIKI